MIANWLPTLTTLPSLLLALFGTGWVLAVSAGLRGSLRRLALAPAFSFALYSVLGVVAARAHLHWDWNPVINATILCALLMLSLRWALRRWIGTDPASVTRGGGALDGWKEQLRADASLIGAAVVTWLLSAFPFFYGGASDRPIQLGDALYHYNQVWAITNTENTSMFSANQRLFGLTEAHSFYPTVWHQIVSLASPSWETNVATTNALIALVALLWCISIVYLSRELFTDHPLAPYVSLGLTALIPAFPWLLTIDKAMWPYCLAVAVCPAVAAFMLQCVHRCGFSWRSGHKVLGVCALLTPLPAVYGVAVAHPSALVVLGWPLVILAWARTGLEGYRMVAGGKHLRGGALLALAFGVVITVAVAVFVPGPWYDYIHRGTVRDWNYLSAKLQSLPLLSYGTVGQNLLTPIHWALAFLQLAGIYTAFRYCKYRSLVVAWLCCLPLTFATMAPIPVLTELTGVFYNNPLRTEAMSAIALIPLLTLGFLEVAKRISLHGREVLAAAGAVFLAATSLSAPLLLGDTRQVFFPNTSDANFMVSESELAMIHHLPDVLPREAVVIGDPVSGAGLLPFMTGRRSVWVFAGTKAEDVDGTYLLKNFRKIHTDPKVCQLLRKHGIDYYYQDVNRRFSGYNTSQYRSGLYGVVTWTGFTKIAAASDGSAVVWRIDVCNLGQRPVVAKTLSPADPEWEPNGIPDPQPGVKYDHWPGAQEL